MDSWANVQKQERTGLLGALDHGVDFDAHWLNDFSLSDLSQFSCNFCHFKFDSLTVER